ncbi:MAG: ABC transporter ATP-binding protein [Lachnospiraceae bacterium]|nr:ABC transporter ATP-binding protein [Lachnospiraceae bacterium]
MNRDDIRNIWLLFREIAGREKRVTVCLLLMSALDAVSPYITICCTGLLLDGVYEGAEVERLLLYAGVALAANLLCRIVRGRASEWFWQKQDYTRELDAREFNRKSLSMDYEYLEDTHVQELRVRALDRSFYGIRGWVLLQILGVLKCILSALTALAIVWPLFLQILPEGSGRAGTAGVLLGFLVLLGLSVWLNARMAVRYAQDAEEILDTLDDVHNKCAYYRDFFSGVETQKDLRINGQQEQIERDMEGLYRASQEGERKMGRAYRKRQLCLVTLSGISTFAVYLFTGIRSYMGLLTIGSVAACAASILQLTGAASTFAKYAGRMKTTALYARDYLEYQNLGRRKYEGTIPVEKRRDNRFQVDFEHVSFRYPGAEEYVIRDLNLSFVIGEKMAIVGRNGSGKTTFIKLLCRLYDVTEGCIKLNGIDIRKYNYEEYCALFAVVFQDFSIFAFPLGENIAGSAGVDEERALDALERAGFGDRLKTLDRGLRTYVGKEFSGEGVSFSGGEKQKMAIARAIYKDASFVIMDEPTAALDPVAECDVYAGFDRMVGEKTALYISHRLASCRFCQDILVFDKGKVVQRGSHEELEAQEGLYRELWNAQAGYYQ